MNRVEAPGVGPRTVALDGTLWPPQDCASVYGVGVPVGVTGLLLIRFQAWHFELKGEAVRRTWAVSRSTW